MEVPASACRNHPERDAIGVCVRCRTRVCAECSTKVDGINYCVGCLAELAGPAVDARASKRAQSSALATAAGGALLALVTLLVWAIFEIALPG